MKPLFTKISKNSQEDLLMKERDLPHFNTPFHFHPECELVYVTRGTGRRIVGDSIENFGPGDMVLLGSNLPHVWYSDNIYYEDDTVLRSCATVLYFNKDIFGERFYDLEESRPLSSLLQEAERGLKVTGATMTNVAQLIQQMSGASGLNRIICLLKIMEQLSISAEKTRLASVSYTNRYDRNDNSRINEVFLFLNKHFARDISLQEVSSLCHMTAPSFCRYFKSRTQTSFIDFLNDIRISHARKLLIENDQHNIAEIAYRCGFHNLSHFNKIFKSRTGFTPTAFRLQSQVPLFQ